MVADIQKILEKMKRQPNGIRLSEVERVLENFGYKLCRQKGSHKHYINEKGDLITIKEENPLKAVYVKDVLNRTGN